MNHDPATSLRRARADLVTERDLHLRKAEELENLVRQTDDMIDMLAGSKLSPGGGMPDDPPTIRQAVLRVLADGEAHHYNAFISELGHVGPPPNNASVRGVVARMAKKNEIDNVGLGKYRLPAPPDTRDGNVEKG